MKTAMTAADSIECIVRFADRCAACERAIVRAVAYELDDSPSHDLDLRTAPPARCAACEAGPDAPPPGPDDDVGDREIARQRERERAALDRARARLKAAGRLPRAGAPVELDCGHRARLPRGMGSGAARAESIAYWAMAPCRECALERAVETADEEIAAGNEALNGRGLAAMGAASMQGIRAHVVERAQERPPPLPSPQSPLARRMESEAAASAALAADPEARALLHSILPPPRTERPQ